MISSSFCVTHCIRYWWLYRDYHLSLLLFEAILDILRLLERGRADLLAALALGSDPIDPLAALHGKPLQSEAVLLPGIPAVDLGKLLLDFRVHYVQGALRAVCRKQGVFDLSE